MNLILWHHFQKSFGLIIEWCCQKDKIENSHEDVLGNEHLHLTLVSNAETGCA